LVDSPAHRSSPPTASTQEPQLRPPPESRSSRSSPSLRYEVPASLADETTCPCTESPLCQANRACYKRKQSGSVEAPCSTFLPGITLGRLATLPNRSASRGSSPPPRIGCPQQRQPHPLPPGPGAGSACTSAVRVTSNIEILLPNCWPGISSIGYIRKIPIDHPSSATLSRRFQAVSRDTSEKLFYLRRPGRSKPP